MEFVLTIWLTSVESRSIKKPKSGKADDRKQKYRSIRTEGFRGLIEIVTSAIIPPRAANKCAAFQILSGKCKESLHFCSDSDIDRQSMRLPFTMDLLLLLLIDIPTICYFRKLKSLWALVSSLIKLGC